jgi:hypothetical protein
MDRLSEVQADRINDFIDREIGGGEFPKITPGQQPCKVYLFPGSYAGQDDNSDSKSMPMPSPENPAEYYAPYGEAMPEGLPDFRETLQRDGLILIKWAKYVCTEGVFFNVLWCKSNGKKRATQWSGYVREEEVPYSMPGDSEKTIYANRNFTEYASCVYTVKVAPESVLQGHISEWPRYVQSLKDSGVIKSNLDYDFNYALERRTSYFKKYRELINLQLPPRTLNVFTDAGITTVKELKAIPLNKLRNIPNLGEKTIQETITALKKHNIILEEEESYAL